MTTFTKETDESSARVTGGRFSLLPSSGFFKGLDWDTMREVAVCPMPAWRLGEIGAISERLSGPHFWPMVMAVPDESSGFAVFELPTGLSLPEWANAHAGDLPIGDLLLMSTKIAGALRVAHAADVVVHPRAHDIFISDRGEPRILPLAALAAMRGSGSRDHGTTHLARDPIQFQTDLVLFGLVVQTVLTALRVPVNNTELVLGSRLRNVSICCVEDRADFRYVSVEVLVNELNLLCLEHNLAPDGEDGMAVSPPASDIEWFHKLARDTPTQKWPIPNFSRAEPPPFPSDALAEFDSDTYRNSPW